MCVRVCVCINFTLFFYFIRFFIDTRNWVYIIPTDQIVYSENFMSKFSL